MNDAIAILEAAYSLTGTEEQWLRRIVEMSMPGLDDGNGLLGFTIDVRRSDTHEVRTQVNCGCDPRLLGAANEFNSSLPEAVRRAIVRIYRIGFVGPLSGAPAALARAGLGERARDFEHMMNQYLREWSFIDARWVNAQDPTQIGCGLVAPLRRRRRFSRRETYTWPRIAAHLAAAFRVRRQLSEAPTAARGVPEAILRPDGKVEHAEEPAKLESARVALRRAVLSFDRARGTLRRRDPEEALALWQALVSGRWSLIEHFDSDGRRFVVAHRNDADVPDMRGLTLRERQALAHAALGHANKVIAYELGLSPSTVAGHLAGARRKLELASAGALQSAEPPARK
jgi:DNA-binding CsgD family transcriptional regulator